MNIYFLKRIYPPDWDEYVAIVVLAKSNQRARQYCKEFFMEHDVTCDKIGTATNNKKERVILADINYG